MADLPPDVSTSLSRDSVTATALVDAAPEAVFDFVRRPANHAIISGDKSVQGTVAGPEILHDGDRFGMSMRIGVPYRMTSRVVEFEDGRRIAWAHPGRHRWRWEVEPAEGGRTRVSETFDLSYAVFPPVLRLIGYPKRHEANVARSVANVAAHFKSSPA